MVVLSCMVYVVRVKALHGGSSGRKKTVNKGCQVRLHLQVELVCFVCAVMSVYVLVYY